MFLLTEWCSRMKADAYPTIYLYHNGQLIEEYMGPHEYVNIYKYIVEKAEHYESIAAVITQDVTPPPPPASPSIDQVTTSLIKEEFHRVHEEL